MVISKEYMELFYYRRLEVYQNAKQLAIKIKDALQKFPVEERFALSDQLRRASTSVMFNIAEGFGRYASKERIRFLVIANGSVMEVSSELELAESYGYISTEELDVFDNLILTIIRQLAKLRSTIQQKE